MVYSIFRRKCFSFFQTQHPMIPGFYSKDPSPNDLGDLGLTWFDSSVLPNSMGFIWLNYRFPHSHCKFLGFIPHFPRWLEPGRRSRTAFCSTSKLRTMVCPNTERRSDGSRNTEDIMIYYPLVNIYIITIKNHHFQWVNQL